MNTVYKKSISSKRFTLIEILVVVGILGILMGIGMGVMTFVLDKAKENRTKSLIKKIEVALENYKSKHGYYVQQKDPARFYLDVVDNSSGDSSRHINNNFCKFIDYSKAIQSDCEQNGSRYYFVDGFGQMLIYICPGIVNTTSYDLISFGSDGNAGSSTTVMIDSDNNLIPNTYEGNYSSMKPVVEDIRDNKENCDDISNF